MRILYHEFESLEHLLATRLLPGGDNRPIRFVVFGGTGAVGGGAVLELCRLILLSKTLGQRPPLQGVIHATGMTGKDVSMFARRMYLALGDEIEIEKLAPLRHYRLDGRIDLHFSLLQLDLPHDLPELMARERRAEGFDLETALEAYFGAQECPFRRFVESLESDLLHAVLVAIPLPSVATYALDTIDRLLADAGLGHAVQQRVKKSYLRTFVRGLAAIQQRYARHVVIAHTTAVGGMYRVDGGTPEIRLGFAHSSLGHKMVEKKYFADELTQLYIDHGFDVLVTAAAVGIDAVEFHTHLPIVRAVRAALRARLESAERPPIDPADLDGPFILHYPYREADLELDPDADDAALDFGAGKDLIVDAAIRSGENGLFSVANCVALYNVMKVAIPEELAMVLVRHAIFGPERRRDWFRDKVCYYHETDNSTFALRLLHNYPELVRAHHGPFAVQAYQALGSATHQARLHEVGLLLLVLRLRELGEKFETLRDETLTGGLTDLDDFLWRHTERPAFEDLDDFDAGELARRFGRLCEATSMEAAGALLGYDPRSHGLRPPGRERFLARLATRIGRHLQTITSLGIPILYRHPDDGRDRLLIGPYVAPLDLAVAARSDLARAWRRQARAHGLDPEVVRDWTIVNNGFVDLRPHAFLTTAKDAGPRLAGQVFAARDEAELETLLGRVEVGAYFTTCGTVALRYRLRRLARQVCGRKIALGTRETWKNLFEQDAAGRHVVSPGLVETVRMYAEGQGKITGTEFLWPSWGY